LGKGKVTYENSLFGNDGRYYLFWDY